MSGRSPGKHTVVRSANNPQASQHNKDTEGDRGTATLWAVGGIAVLCLLAVVVLTYSSVVQTKHRVAAAADLAALAGAGYAPYGEGAACEQARWVATHMRVSVTKCLMSNWDVSVVVSAALPNGLTRFGPVLARGRAGPAAHPPGMR